MASVKVPAPSPLVIEPSEMLPEIKEEITQLEERLHALEQAGSTHHQEISAPLSLLQEKIQKIEENQLRTAESLSQIEEQLGLLQEWMKKTQTSVLSPSPKDPKQLFLETKKLCKAGSVDHCLSHCERVLRPDLKLPSTQKAECLRLRAEAWTKKGEHKKAIVEWSQLNEQYPRSVHVPYGLLKTAEAFQALGLTSSGKPFLEELLQRFPKSQEAQKAKTLLKKS